MAAERAASAALRAEASKLIALGRAELSGSPSAALAFAQASLEVGPEVQQRVVRPRQPRQVLDDRLLLRDDRSVPAVDDPGRIVNVGYDVDLWTGRLRKRRMERDIFTDSRPRRSR